MNHTVLKKLAPRFLAGALCLVVLAGCESKLKPDAQGVMDYLDNAVWHGNVYRLWPEGQAYVDRVLKARSEYVQALAPLQPYSDFTQLWPIESPNWRNEDMVRVEIDKITLMLDTANAQAQLALKNLEKAVDAIPEGTNLAPNAFAENVWVALEGEEGDLRERLEYQSQPASEYVEILKAALERSDEFAPASPGLAFIKGSASEAVSIRYQEMLQKRRAELDASISGAYQDALTIIELRQSGIIPASAELNLSKRDVRMDKREKATLKNKITQCSNYLTDVRRKFMERANTAEKALKEAEKASESGKDASVDKPKLEYLRLCAEQTAQDREHYGERTTQLLEEIKKAEMPEPVNTPDESQ